VFLGETRHQFQPPINTKVLIEFQKADILLEFGSNPALIKTSSEKPYLLVLTVLFFHVLDIMHGCTHVLRNTI